MDSDQSGLVWLGQKTGQSTQQQAKTHCYTLHNISLNSFFYQLLYGTNVQIFCMNVRKF